MKLFSVLLCAFFCALSLNILSAAHIGAAADCLGSPSTVMLCASPANLTSPSASSLSHGAASPVGVPISAEQEIFQTLIELIYDHGYDAARITPFLRTLPADDLVHCAQEYREKTAHLDDENKMLYKWVQKALVYCYYKLDAHYAPHTSKYRLYISLACITGQLNAWMARSLMHSESIQMFGHLEIAGHRITAKTTQLSAYLTRSIASLEADLVATLMPLVLPATADPLPDTAAPAFNVDDFFA